VVRWRTCDLIMRLHEEFGISVSDDTVYRGLKELGRRSRQLQLRRGAVRQ
jgi:transposase